MNDTDITHAPPLLPAGTLVEMTLDLIDEGNLKSEVNRHIAEAIRVLDERRKRGADSGGKCKITMTVELGFDKDLVDHVRLTHHVQTKTPKNERASLAKAVHGRLLVAPDGSRADSPDQLRLFDHFGRPIGRLDPLTGVITQEPAPEKKETVGRVGRVAAS